MADKWAWAWAKRAQARAILLLTERSDFELAIGPETDDGVDLYVYPKNGTAPTRNVLGIQVKGRRKLRSVEATHLSESVLERHEIADWPHPECLFLFEADGDEAYYQWLAEPVSNGHKELVKPVHAMPQKLDTQAIDELFRQVREWYAAMPKEMAA